MEKVEKLPYTGGDKKFYFTNKISFLPLHFFRMKK
jgi:hypothetical protein